MQFSGRHVLVLGFGETGLAMLHWLTGQGARLRAADSRPAQASPDTPTAKAAPNLGLVRSLAEEAYCGRFSTNLLDQIDVLAVSPGIAANDALLVEARARGIPIVGEIELFALAFNTKRAALLESGEKLRLLAITGTNGKTTVTALTQRMAARALQPFGRSAVACGNISPSALAAWRAAEEANANGAAWPLVWVLELSSFQLETCPSLEPDAALVLNVTEDHLDWHGSMDAYAAAKARIFNNGALQVLNRDDTRVLAMQRPFVPKRKKDLPSPTYTFGAQAPSGRSVDEVPSEFDFGLGYHGGVLWLQQGAARLMPVEALKIKGLHNATNALAALALCRAIDLPFAPCINALAEYTGEAHRVETIGHVNGADYVDDSKGTNVGATVAALNGLGATQGTGRLIVILGGDGKGQDFSPLAAPVARYARAVLTLGKDAARIESALTGTQVPHTRVATLEEAVNTAQRLAQPGDTVLLSPACASLDMFRNYGHRAQVFVDAVRALEALNAQAAFAPQALNQEVQLA